MPPQTLSDKFSGLVTKLAQRERLPTGWSMTLVWNGAGFVVTVEYDTGDTDNFEIALPNTGESKDQIIEWAGEAIRLATEAP